jgi:hypothetical protein
MPIYRRGSYAGETVALQNDHMRVEVHKRLTGWGWGEIFNARGDLVAVLDHLGEILLRDQEIPMRLEAQDVRRSSDAGGESLTFEVRSLVVREKLKGTSFEPWMDYPLNKPILTGEVVLTLALDAPVLHIRERFVSLGNVTAFYVRGPWVKVGQDAFGAAKDDAIFPGVEWLVGDEWSSGVDWFKDPWAMKWVPHPHKVTAPVMAVSHGGTGIGLAWNPNQRATGWFNHRYQRPQPVFASPNFIDRDNNHLLGLMVPDVEVEAHENQVYADPPLELHLAQRIDFDAELFLCEGKSLDVLVDWVNRHGMPVPPAPRWPLQDALLHIVEAYTTHLWHPGEGFGTPQHPIHPSVPRFAEGYLSARGGTPLAASLQEKVAWCEAQGGAVTRRWPLLQCGDLDVLLAQGHELLLHQREDGTFPFDPDGQHYQKDDFVVARAYLEPMGLSGDTALDITILPAMELLALGEATGEESFREAARRAFDVCLSMVRPEGGDYWETPLHAPNLLAAGHAANGYVMAYRAFDDARYLQKAVTWIRALLPFTHLWEPQALPMIYNTKPCLCSSDWYFANWVRDHVQWEVLETFAQAVDLGIDWGEVDPELDWHTYQKGITIAALRWMVDHREAHWLPHNMPWTYEDYLTGAFDDCFADTHNSVTGNYGGMVIMPDAIAVNLLDVLGREGAPA